MRQTDRLGEFEVDKTAGAGAKQTICSAFVIAVFSETTSFSFDAFDTFDEVSV